MNLLYDEDDFSVSDDGKLRTKDLNITSQGAIKVRKADWSLGETDVKLRSIGIDVSEDFQQTNGVLSIRNQGNGRIPFYQVGSGFASNGILRTMVLIHSTSDLSKSLKVSNCPITTFLQSPT